MFSKDIRDNSQQMVAAEAHTRDLDTFLVQLDNLTTVFPWTLKLKWYYRSAILCCFVSCSNSPMALARVEADGVTIERFAIAPEDVERVSGAYAEIAFAQQDLEDEAAEEAEEAEEAARLAAGL